MKHDLEGYREVILLVNSILKWDKPFYAGIIFGVVSISFSLLWYLNLSILTLVSLLCLIGILSEYAFPIVSKFIPKSDNWTGVQEKIFEDVCNEILTVKIKTCCFVKYLFVSKQEKTLMVSDILVSELVVNNAIEIMLSIYSTTSQLVLDLPFSPTSDASLTIYY